MTGEVREREIAEVRDQRLDLGLGAGLQVRVARDRRRVDVEPAGAAPDEQALRIEPRHHGQQRRIGADLAAARVERLLDLAHGRLRTRPELFHDFGFQRVEHGWAGNIHVIALSWFLDSSMIPE